MAEKHYRWLYRGQQQIRIDNDIKEVHKPDEGDALLLSFTLSEDKDTGETIHVFANKDTLELMKKNFPLTEGDTFRLVHAEPMDKNDLSQGFTESLVEWNVKFDGTNFVKDPDVDDIDFIVIE